MIAGSNSEESWSSDAEPLGRRFRRFQEMLDRTHSHWALKSDCASAFNARIRRRPVGDYALTWVDADPVTGVRADADIRLEKSAYFCLLHLTAGDVLLRQGRNESVLGRASVAVWDSTRPAFFRSDKVIRQFAILVPHRIATTVIPGIEEMSGCAIDGREGLGNVLFSHLARVHRTIDAIGPDDRPALMRATVELLAATFRPGADVAGTSAFRRALLARVQDYVLAHLGDPQLGPRSIAAAFQFSPRYLHRLFEETGVTVADWIRQRRLLASQCDLANPACATLSITQIAMRRGFGGSSHFSNAFKQAFGLSPRDYRRQAHKPVN